MISVAPAAENECSAHPRCTISESAPIRIDLTYDEAAVEAGGVTKIGVAVTPQVSVEQFQVVDSTVGPVELVVPRSVRREFVVSGEVVPIEMNARYVGEGLSTIHVIARAIEAGAGFGRIVCLSRGLRTAAAQEPLHSSAAIRSGDPFR